MKKIILMMLMVFMSMGLLFSNVYAGGAGTYSHGFRMGQLTKFSIKGFVMKSGEGQMLLGSESTPYAKRKGENTETVNPWKFSSQDKSIQRELDQNVGEYVVLAYNQARVKYPNVDTEYDITAILPITGPVTKPCIARSNEGGKKSAGKRVGRIVKASTKGTLIKSWEVMIQQGNSGNQFKNMSITDDVEMYECAIKYLKAGQKVKIYYKEAYMNVGQETKYDIWKIEPAAGLN